MGLIHTKYIKTSVVALFFIIIFLSGQVASAACEYYYDRPDLQCKISYQRPYKNYKDNMTKAWVSVKCTKTARIVMMVDLQQESFFGVWLTADGDVKAKTTRYLKIEAKIGCRYGSWSDWRLVYTIKIDGKKLRKITTKPRPLRCDF
ncbi:MAG: hypothetical protein MUF85_02915 [Patescibacteria group bacterium]|jgi:hypothetical protein|nr:hypothetical protein [Patescibacteria group bacterium]